jgi:hypothetical protein
VHAAVIRAAVEDLVAHRVQLSFVDAIPVEPKHCRNAAHALNLRARASYFLIR